MLRLLAMATWLGGPMGSGGGADGLVARARPPVANKSRDRSLQPHSARAQAKRGGASSWLRRVAFTKVCEWKIHAVKCFECAW